MAHDSHPADPVSTPANARLRAYLAANDVKCEGCGYNLRGATTVACPECGRIIEAPASTRPLDQMALKCHRCGYLLHGLSTGACPECGATDVRLGDYDARMARRTKRRVPIVLGLCAAIGLLLALWRVWMVAFLPLPTPLSAQRMLLSLPVCLAPPALAVLVFVRPNLLRAESAGATFTRRTVVSAVGVLLVTVSLAIT